MCIRDRFRYFLDNIPAWDNTILQTKPITEFINLLAEQIERMTGITKAELVPELAHLSTYNSRAREEFKHSVGTKLSGFNPTIYINDAKADNAMNWSLD